MNKLLFLLLAVIVLGGGAYYFLNTNAGNDLGNSEKKQKQNTDSNTSAMRAEENMVVVSEQRPGTTVTGSLIVLAAPGYLVIHEDNGSGEAGTILGASELISTGKSRNVKVTLSRSSRDGETLHAMLHFEKGGNASFSAEDTPAQSVLGGPISGWFLVSLEAPLDVPISI